MNTDTNAFEVLLKQKNSEDNKTIIDYIDTSITDRLVADTNASIDGFTDMLAMIISKTMKKQKVEFVPDEGARLYVDQNKEIDHPYIYFDIVDDHTKMEIKPRIREARSYTGNKHEIESDEQNGTKRRSEEIWGQVFYYTLQFDIFAGGYKESTQVMNDLKDIIFSYTAYFMRNGVKNIYFKRRLTDRNLDMYRQKCSIRSIQYDVIIEELFSKFNANIEEVIVR